MTTKRLSVTEFKAHCTEEVRKVEETGTVVELTRHGKTVAFVCPPAAGAAAPKLADWLGSGKGTVSFSPTYQAAEPAIEPGDWES